MLICVDLDGTLFDTVPVNAAAYREALAPEGAVMTDEYYAKYCDGKRYTDFIPPLLGGDPPPEQLRRVHDRKQAAYPRCLDMAVPNRALLGLLDAARGRCDLALVTTGSRRNVTEILQKFGCLDWFGLIVTGEDVARSKPDPECYRLAMAHFGASPDETVIFEDSPTGLAAAKASGAVVFKLEKE